MRFRSITKSDKDKLYELYAKQKTLGTEYSLVTMYLWHHDYDVETVVGKDYMCIRLFYKGKLYYFPPITTNKKRFQELLDALIDMGAKDFAEITDKTLPEFCKRNFSIEPNRDMAEYVYSSKSFINLPGKALHAKRNHIAKFENAYAYRFESYHKSHRDGVEQLFDNWIQEKSAYYNNIKEQKDAIEKAQEQFLQSVHKEKSIVFTVLDNLSFYHCFADVLLVDERIIGLTIGEILPTGVGAVYFEKADTGYAGAYTMLSNLFARKHFPNTIYINRQEDMGDEGLRQAKLSYRPKHIFMKYVASNKKDSCESFCKDVIELYKDSFPEDDARTVDFFFNHVFSPNYMKNFRVGDQLVSALHIVPKSLDYLGTLITLPFIVALATDKRYKHQGYASRLLQETLHCMKSQKIAFTALYPAVDGFYEQFGFQKVFRHSKLTTFAASNLETKATSDIDQLKEIFSKKTSPYQVKIVRDKKQTELKYGVENGANLLYLDGELIGYELIGNGGERSEVCLLPSEKEDSAAYETVSEPVGMARLLDLESAFSLLHLKKQYKFKLTDCIFEDNNGVYEAQGNTIMHGTGYDFTLTERQLCAVFFGLEADGVPQTFIEEFPKLVFVPDKY